MNKNECGFYMHRNMNIRIIIIEIIIIIKFCNLIIENVLKANKIVIKLKYNNNNNVSIHVSVYLFMIITLTVTRLTTTTTKQTSSTVVGPKQHLKNYISFIVDNVCFK